MLGSSNWTWLTGGWGNMADLAERVDDLICSFDSASADSTMDTLSMLIFGWMLLGLVILCVGKFIYNRVHQRKKQQAGVHHPAAATSTATVAAAAAAASTTTSSSATATTGASTSSAAASHAGPKRAAGAAGSASSKDGPTSVLTASLHSISENVMVLGAGASATGVAAAVARSRSANAARSHGGSLSPAGSGYLGVPGSSSGGYVSPTPPLRKRVTRKNSGVLPSPQRGAAAARSMMLPHATGADHEAVRWTNEMIYWLHTDLVVLDELLAVWVDSLNDFVASSIAEHGIGVEFVRVLPETHPPTLSNIFCECDSKDDVTITCDCEATPALQLKAFRQHGDKIETSHYRVNVNRFRARLNVVCITEKLLVDLKCDGWPEVKVSLAPVGAIKKDLEENHLQELLTDIVVSAIRGTNLHLNLSGYANCPRLWREPAPTGYSMPMHYDSLAQGSNASGVNRQRHVGSSVQPMVQQYAPGDRRLLVKVLHATDLAGQVDCYEPYCVVELDDPPQRHQTAHKNNTKNPVWNEAFLFDVSPNTTEVLLEVYDRLDKEEKFLGLGIVGIEELLANPSQRQVIPLQARPYEQDEVSGKLTVEFLFIEGADVPQIGSKPYKVKETIRQQHHHNQPSSPTRTYNPTNTMLGNNSSLNYNNGNSTLILYDSTNEPGGDFMTNGSTMDDSPYRTGHSNGNKGTLIVHSQQRQAERQVVKVTLSENGGWQELAAEHDTIPSGQDSTPNSSNSDGLRDRGRSRRKRRDFFGTIKKRLSRSKTRSRSIGPDGDTSHEEAHSRSISADRAKEPGSGRDEHSRRSSISEASAISGTSTKTYINEASTLVLETLENGIRKHYLVPLSLAQKSKWKKKGTKLHIFNDHTFIAKHMPGGTVCEVCKRTLARRLGKQGYECRDCLMKCHKHCHVKVDTMCSSSTIQSIELTYVKTPELKRKAPVRIC
uniref:C2 domain-containing protein n=1 Tax=Trichogramma kaykai TaxID=54128 RepID=A0ABD2W6J6_9HYME